MLEAARAYYNALIWGAPATLLNFVLLGWFLGREQGKQVLLLSLISKSVNIVLDYLFIVRLGQSSAGAGAATAISQGSYCGCRLIFSLWRIAIRDSPKSDRLNSLLLKFGNYQHSKKSSLSTKTF